MDTDSPYEFELPVFSEPQREPEPMGYENAVRAFEQILRATRVREDLPQPEVIPEFRI
jgi:hypothetical protein